MLRPLEVMNDFRMLRRGHIDVNETVVCQIRRGRISAWSGDSRRDGICSGGKWPDGECPLTARIRDCLAERLYCVNAPVLSIELNR